MIETSTEAVEEFNVTTFLGELGIAELVDSPIQDHEGNMTTFGRALEDCKPARDEIRNVKQTLEEVGVVDVSTALKRHVAKMAPPPEVKPVKKN